jgi:hypothetical protein
MDLCRRCKGGGRMSDELSVARLGSNLFLMANKKEKMQRGFFQNSPYINL